MEQQSGQQAVRHLAEQVRPMAPAEGSRETAVSYLTVTAMGPPACLSWRVPT